MMNVPVALDLIAALALTGYVISARRQFSLLSQGLKPLAIGIGLIPLSFIILLIEGGALGQRELCVLLRIEDLDHVGATRMIGAAYVIMLYGLEILAALAFRRLGRK